MLPKGRLYDPQGTATTPLPGQGQHTAPSHRKHWCTWSQPLIAGLSAAPLSHTKQLSLCSPPAPRGAHRCLGQFCRVPASSFGLYRPTTSRVPASSFGLYLPTTSTVLGAPCNTQPMTARPFFAAPLLYGAAHMTALGGGKSGAVPHPNPSPSPTRTIKKYIYSHRNTTQLCTLNGESIKPDSLSWILVCTV